MTITTKFIVTAVTTKLVVPAVMTKLVSTAVTTKLVVTAITTKLPIRNLKMGHHTHTHITHHTKVDVVTGLGSLIKYFIGLLRLAFPM